MKNLICPICKNNLKRIDKSYKCDNKHTFDISKEGYVNLLPVNGKKSKDPGDNLQMITARRSFLQSGYYEKLVKTITKILNDLIVNKNNLEILDIGCGEGYYTNYLSNGLNVPNSITGLDISKSAVKYGSKLHKNVDFIVASAYNLPIKENSMDIVYRIYAPSLSDEVYRVLKSDGIFLTVTPGERHLFQLRELIYDEVKKISHKSDENNNFTKFYTSNLKYLIEIDDYNTLKSLIDMTPFGWKISNESLKILENMDSWNIECDFIIDIFRKH
ncbi:MAG: 23S rRNA (guanine(745)-N(1))-methyltransferase [Spirochaetales bacterium]|nr:23S rRNA (guanine(745)-N(1))-methyltransferase [Spirochaetales bacterium]